MDSTNSKEVSDKERKLIDFLKSNEIPFDLVKCCCYNRICISFEPQNDNHQKYCCNADIIVSTTDKNSYRITPANIIFVTVEKRKTILFLTTGKLETKYPLNYWRKILDMRMFSQPHNSYIVNLNYVSEIKNGIVNLSYGDINYNIYSSHRKIPQFKKALINYYNLTDRIKDFDW